MKYTLNSQEYNDIFKTAQEKFDIEMLKREKSIMDMNKKLMIINYTNEFINNKVDRINAGIYYNNKLKVFDRNLSGLYNRTLNEIDITNTYNIPQEYYETTDVIKMEPIEVEGNITYSVLHRILQNNCTDIF